MFGHRSFLVLGGGGPADIVSLIKGGYEILDCVYSLEQGIDERGKATTRVYGGSFDITLSQLPPRPIVEWVLNSRKYSDGAVIVLDEQNTPVSKILFEHATCTCFDINYMQQGSGYVATKLLIQAERVIFDDGIEFNNEWTETE
jgi:hypothetical protein